MAFLFPASVKDKNKPSPKSNKSDMNFLIGDRGDGGDNGSSKDTPNADDGNIAPAASSAASSATNYFPVETYRKLGTDASRAISLVTKLKEAGAEYDLELPRLVFAGKQSAGKSSIVKALTSVQLPRHYGTCTRCPIEVTTKNAPGQPWTCRISLRITVDDESGGQYSPPVIEECCVLQEPKDMPEQIEQAQKILLERVTNGTNFTANVVCVNIAGDGCPDLSLVDLPGLIQSTENKDDEGDIGRVEELVRSYLESSETVILQCIASDEDLENQSIRKLARDVDPEGKRSIGILTKPDKVDIGCEDAIVSILKGEKYPLAQGYYIVRTPKQDELNKLKESDANVSAFEEARSIENDFFRFHEVGKVFYENAPERCGSAKLLYKLASMLQTMIDEHIPAIKANAETALARTETELKGLGEQMSEADARMELIELARKISNHSTEAIKSTTRDKSFWRRTVEIFEDVNAKVNDTSPMFQIGDKVIFASLLNLDTTPNGFLRESVTMHISADEFQAIVDEAHSSNELILSPIQSVGGMKWQLQVGQESGNLAVRLTALDMPADIQNIGVVLQFDTKNLTLISGELPRTETTLMAGCPSQPKLFSWPYNGSSFFIGVSIKILSYTPLDVTDRAYHISEVQEMLENTSGREFPGIRLSSSAVCQELIGETVELWKDPAFDSSKTIHNLLRYHLLGADAPKSAINQCVNPRYKKLKRVVNSIIFKHVNRLEEESIQQISKLVEMEKPPFFALNDFFLLDSRSKFQDVVEMLDLNRVCDDEVKEVIVSTLSFLRIKQKVFVENVIHLLLHHCLGTFENECERVLLDGLGLVGEKRKTDNDLLRLFAEEDEIFFRRRDLQQRQTRQKTAVDLITSHLEDFEY